MKNKRLVFAVSSPGGHFHQLLKILPAAEGHDLVVACTHPDYAQMVPGATYHSIPDASLESKWRLLWQALVIAKCLIRHRPDVIITTGASAGHFAVRIGRWLGAKTLWLDSVANAEESSRSGARTGPHADLWLTQWKHLTQPGGPSFRGSVL